MRAVDLLVRVLLKNRFDSRALDPRQPLLRIIAGSRRGHSEALAARSAPPALHPFRGSHAIVSPREVFTRRIGQVDS